MSRLAYSISPSRLIRYGVQNSNRLLCWYNFMVTSYTEMVTSFRLFGEPRDITGGSFAWPLKGKLRWVLDLQGLTHQAD
jgi:hypothetical protein